MTHEPGLAPGLIHTDTGTPQTLLITAVWCGSATVVVTGCAAGQLAAARRPVLTDVSLVVEVELCVFICGRHSDRGLLGAGGGT